jgi:hypothetical protein
VARPLLCNRIASQDFLDLSLCTESPLCKKVIICTLIDETEISMSPASNIPFSVNQPTFIAVFIFIGILAGLKIVVDKWVSDKQRGETPQLLPRHVPQFRRLEAQAGAGPKARQLSLRVLWRACYTSAPQTVRAPEHRQRANRMACSDVQALLRAAT